MPEPEAPVQHGKPGPPQVPQVPALQVPPPAPTQVLPTAMQIPDTQQPPALQLLPSQQGVPGCPHVGESEPPFPAVLLSPVLGVPCVPD